MELNRLWERFEKGTVDVPGIDEAMRLMSSIREELRALEDLRKEDIEGVLWTGLDDIRRDLSHKEMSLGIFLFPLKGKNIVPPSVVKL